MQRFSFYHAARTPSALVQLPIWREQRPERKYLRVEYGLEYETRLRLHAALSENAQFDPFDAEMARRDLELLDGS